MVSRGGGGEGKGRNEIYIKKSVAKSKLEYYFLVFRFNDKFPEDALELQEIEEGDEPDLFWDALRGDQSHVSLIKGAKNKHHCSASFTYI